MCEFLRKSRESAALTTAWSEKADRFGSAPGSSLKCANPQENAETLSAMSGDLDSQRQFHSISGARPALATGGARRTPQRQNLGRAGATQRTQGAEVDGTPHHQAMQ